MKRWYGVWFCYGKNRSEKFSFSTEIRESPYITWYVLIACKEYTRIQCFKWFVCLLLNIRKKYSVLFSWNLPETFKAYVMSRSFETLSETLSERCSDDFRGKIRRCILFQYQTHCKWKITCRNFRPSRLVHKAWIWNAIVMFRVYKLDLLFIGSQNSSTQKTNFPNMLESLYLNTYMQYAYIRSETFSSKHGRVQLKWERTHEIKYLRWISVYSCLWMRNKRTMNFHCPFYAGSLSYILLSSFPIKPN